jgi:hypothetical protein
MDQVFHHYETWEEYKAGMWRNPTSTEINKMLPEAIKFTGNHVVYGQAMMNVLEAWPISCEHNLSNATQNRRAWIGHAAACCKKGFPESVTRLAWGHLSNKQQELANEQADKAIDAWEEKILQRKQYELW